jgi:hypothetical protein
MCLACQSERSYSCAKGLGCQRLTREKLANAKLREAFMKKWRNVETPEKFDENWDTLMTEYAEHYDLITSLQTSQYPQRFESAAAWTSEWAHFGSISTSVLEASHGQLSREFTRRSTQITRRQADTVSPTVIRTAFKSLYI